MNEGTMFILGIFMGVLTTVVIGYIYITFWIKRNHKASIVVMLDDPTEDTISIQSHVPINELVKHKYAMMDVVIMRPQK